MSDQPSKSSGGTSHLLPNERAKASFNVESMTNLLDGGKQKTARRHFILSPGEGYDMGDKHFLTREELLAKHVKDFMDMHKPYLGKMMPETDDFTWMSENTMIQGTLGNHFGLFLPTIMRAASEDQIRWWLLRAFSGKIIGSYAQTELGHGSNVRGLETTAHYDRATQEFVLNTPTLTSMKWWPGTLGRVATHAIVYAQLVLDGKEYGVHAFMLQMRDENHKPFPGIEAGDLGPKLGDGANDTGYMILNNVRVPREFMLSKHQHVTPEGKYVKAPSKTNDKLHYSTMMYTRASMMRSSAGQLARAVTIAVRYSAVRHQGFEDTSTNSYKSVEKPILDYQIQLYRLMKQVALTYAIKFTGRWLAQRMDALNLSSGDTSDLPELAASSAGLKALCTFLVAEGIEDCRKCCGGNGYLLASGVAAQAGDYVWQTTAEGDFVVMVLQLARYLNKSYKQTIEGQQPSGICEYLLPLRDPNFEPIVPQPFSADDFKSVDFLVKLFRSRTLSDVANVCQSLNRVSKTNPADFAWNQHSVQLQQASYQHCFYFLMSKFAAVIKDVTDPSLKAVLERVCAFFGVSQIYSGNWSGYFTIHSRQYLEQAMAQLLNELRPDAVALVDSFDIPDRVLNSAIGRYDGNVYESLYEHAKRNPLNQREVFEGYKDLRPHLDVEFLKIGNKNPDTVKPAKKDAKL